MEDCIKIHHTSARNFISLLDFWTSGAFEASGSTSRSPEVTRKCSRSPEVQKSRNLIVFFTDVWLAQHNSEMPLVGRDMWAENVMIHGAECVKDII